jgi:hypothetical protein
MTTQEIKKGDFIKGQYAFGCINGIVTKVNKNNVVINRHLNLYNEFTPTNELVNVTKSRIYQVGLNTGETIK